MKTYLLLNGAPFHEDVFIS